VTDAAGWRLDQREGPAGALHRPWPGEDRRGERAVAVCSVVGQPALVLGSTQPEALADRSRLDDAGIDLVRRASGGGAVLVRPDAQVWVDVWVPVADPQWSDDVIRAPQWLGDLWVDALSALGGGSGVVHRGRSVPTSWSSLICFAGVGPGEVSVAGRKVVGLSQRRNRHGARISTMAVLDWEPAPLADLLAVPDEERLRMVQEVADVAVGLRAMLEGADSRAELAARVTEALLAQLPLRS